MAGIPTGRSSSVKAQEKTFILQTEFRVAPRPAIVTSVTLDGQTVHKVERSYGRPWDSQEDFDAAQAAVMNQHLGLERKIRSNSADFIRQTGTIKISLADRLGIIPGVAFVNAVDEALAAENTPPIYRQAQLILEIADAITQSSKNGGFRMAGVVNDQGKYLVDRDDKHAYLVSLKPEADIGQVLKEAMEG